MMSSTPTRPRARTIPALLAVAVLMVTALQLGAARSLAAVSQTMHATVHEDQSIALVFDDGTPVGNQAWTPPTIPPGTYTSLSGVAFVGTHTVTVNLAAGRWSFSTSAGTSKTSFTVVT